MAYPPLFLARSFSFRSSSFCTLFNVCEAGSHSMLLQHLSSSKSWPSCLCSAAPHSFKSFFLGEKNKKNPSSRKPGNGNFREETIGAVITVRHLYTTLIAVGPVVDEKEA